MKKIFAFTLAEVLITLSILGVVAAITVPSLIKRQHRNEVETKLAKFYSTMETAFDTSVAENGPAERWTVDDGIAKENKAVVIANNYLIPYLNVVGDIPTTPVKKWDVKNPKTGNNASEQGWWNSSSSTYQLKDGMTFGVQYSGGFGEIMFIRVDINGAKGPNVVGKDNFVFGLYVSNDTFCNPQPGVCFGNTESGKNKINDPSIRAQLINGCKNGSNHFFCTNLIGLNRFKIPSDYPWL